MEFRETTQSDMDFMARHSASHKSVKELPGTIDYVYTLEHNGEILGVGGVKIMNQWTAWAWMDWSENAKDHLIVGFRVVKEWLGAFMEEKGITRLMASVEVDFEEAIRTVEHLGFSRESLLLGFFGDKDGYMYVRLAEK